MSWKTALILIVLLILGIKGLEVWFAWREVMERAEESSPVTGELSRQEGVDEWTYGMK